MPQEFNATMIAGLGIGALAALVTLIVVGYSRPAQKVVGGEEISLTAGRLLSLSLDTIRRDPGPFRRILALGVIGSVIVDAILIAGDSLVLVSNLVWFVINAALVFFWHRAILLKSAHNVGFGDKPASLVTLMTRMFILSLLILLFALGAALATLIPAQAVSGLAAPAGAIFGSGLVASTAWWSRFSLSMPATSLRQPSGGLFEMFARGKGVGIQLAAALLTIVIALTVAGVLLLIPSDLLWSLLDPAGFDAHQTGANYDLYGMAPVTPATLLTYSVPMGVVLALNVLLSVSCVSVAYREWVLPEFATPNEEGDTSPDAS